MPRRMIVIQAGLESFDAQGHQIDFARMPRTCGGTRSARKLAEELRIEVSGVAPDKREQPRYGLERYRLARELPMRSPRPQDIDEFGIGQVHRRQFEPVCPAKCLDLCGLRR